MFDETFAAGQLLSLEAARSLALATR